MIVLHRFRPLLLFAACLLLLTLSRGAGAQDQPLVTQIDVGGARKVEEATVRFKLKTRVGDPYSPEIVREDIKALYGLGYFEDIVVRADIFEGGLKLTFELHEKPSIQSIRIVGNRKIATDKIKGKIDLVEGAIIPPGALAKSADKIKLFYEEEGYYQARIDGKEERLSSSEVGVTFSVVEGDKFDLREIRILGAQRLKEKDIKSKMQTSELFLWFFGGTLKREEITRDLDRIRAYYLDNGFLDIAVEAPQIQVEPARKRLRVVIQVQEGPQYRIGQLTLKGNRLFTDAEISAPLKSRAGGIFSRESLQSDVTAVTDKYADRGYLFADVMPVTDVRRGETTVDVALEIVEGQQAFIRRIEITGNLRTRDKVIRRELALVEGDVFSSTRLQASRKNLENMGFFEEVKPDTRRVGTADQVDVTVDLKEKATGAFTIGGGFSSVDGVIAVAGISQANLFGLGKRAALSGQIGAHANRYTATYTDPHFLDSDYLLDVRGYDTQTRYVTNQGFNTDTLGGSVGIGHHLVEAVFWQISYGYEDVKLKDVQQGAPFLVTQQAAVNGGVSTTSRITLSLLRDVRDSYTEPTSGSRVSLAGEYAGGILGADNSFTKYTGEASKYWPLWWKFVGHIRGNASYGNAFDGTPTLPVQERFFLGGPNSIRGFRNFTISPKGLGPGVPQPFGVPSPPSEGLTGGNLSWFTNWEVLFPLYEQLRLRGLAFVDFGQVYATDEQSLSLSDIFKQSIKRSAGVGIRFNSPLGAIRLEWGFNLHRLPGERMQVIHFSAGTSF